jgi:hypothetical protein
MKNIQKKMMAVVVTVAVAILSTSCNPTTAAKSAAAQAEASAARAEASEASVRALVAASMEANEVFLAEMRTLGVESAAASKAVMIGGMTMAVVLLLLGVAAPLVWFWYKGKGGVYLTEVSGDCPENSAETETTTEAEPAPAAAPAAPEAEASKAA